MCKCVNGNFPTVAIHIPIAQRFFPDSLQMSNINDDEDDDDDEYESRVIDFGGKYLHTCCFFMLALSLSWSGLAWVLEIRIQGSPFAYIQGLPQPTQPEPVSVFVTVVVGSPGASFKDVADISLASTDLSLSLCSRPGLGASSSSTKQ